MAMKYEWRKKEKQYYLTNLSAEWREGKPEKITLPTFKFLTIKGQGNPNSDAFVNYVQALYAASYAIRMSHKKDMAPPAYFEYTVYPLEGVWDLTEEARAKYDGTFSKDDLVFQLMIRQPEFVDAAFAQKMIDWTMAKKKLPLLEQLKFEEIEEGTCVQMLHLGSYDNEPATFARMEAYTQENGWTRACKTHREIYLTDARKTPPEKLKTVLRFKITTQNQESAQ